MDRIASFAEVQALLQRPPFYPKLALASRIVSQLGSVVIVINHSQEWESALVTGVQIINVPMLSLNGSLTQLLIVWGILLFILLSGLLAGWVTVERMRKSQPPPPLLIKILRLVLGVICTKEGKGGDRAMRGG